MKNISFQKIILSCRESQFVLNNHTLKIPLTFQKQYSMVKAINLTMVYYLLKKVYYLFKKVSISLTLMLLILWIYRQNVYYSDFDDVQLAFEVVHQFQREYIKADLNNQSKTPKITIGRDILKYYHPGTVLEDYYIYRSQTQGDSMRSYIRKNYFDSQPWHEVFQTSQVKVNKEKLPSIVHYQDYMKFTSSIIYALSRSRQGVMQNVGILERLQHMPIPTGLCDKITIAKNMNKRLEKFISQNKSQECLRDALFQKKTYILDKPEDCEAFFAKAIPEYNNNSTKEVYNYVKKNDLHDQKGTELAFKAVFAQVAEKYDYGRNCSLQNNSHQLIMQEYISSPLTLDGRKFDIRLHVLIVSTNPLILYLYKKFYLMKCSYKFDHDEFRNQSHICSAGYQRKLHAKLAQTNNLTEFDNILPVTQVTEPVTYEEFARRLLAEGKIKDLSWVDTYMIPEMEKRFHHYMQSYFDEAGQWPDPRTGEYKACEFNIDDQLNFWLLECTTNPNMIIKPGRDTMNAFQTQLHADSIPIIIKYARAKYLRITKMIREFLIPQIRDKGKNLFKTHYKLIWPKIKAALYDQVIKDKKIDAVHHLVDFQRAGKSCE